MTRVLKSCWSWLAMAAMGLGLVLGAVLLLALVLGGTAAVALTGWAAALIPWCIGVAALAMAVGLVVMYARGEHTLTVSGDGPAKEAEA